MDNLAWTSKISTLSFWAITCFRVDKNGSADFFVVDSFQEGAFCLIKFWLLIKNQQSSAVFRELIFTLSISKQLIYTLCLVIVNNTELCWQGKRFGFGHINSHIVHSDIFNDQMMLGKGLVLDTAGLVFQQAELLTYN